MSQKKHSRAKKSFALRVEPELYDALERMAASEFRSVNAQIEVLLREAMTRRGVKLGPPQKRPRGRPPRLPNDNQE
ncbi:toxin-antitoxin system HicB family antitoxin [Parasphingorhabdus sp. DH2-15]|uniref:toxin-antitoxin system HicB family antitoxin n=1 Tax=Parasphingorhabdus sp. DH2-15 TaxID=3444112 RepID=UPI003F687557